MYNIKIIFFSIVVALSFFGCSSSEKTQAPEDVRAKNFSPQPTSENGKSAALQYFINASLLESKGQYAEAIIEYLDALRYDDDHAIYYSLAKNYTLLGKYGLASDNAEKAVERDSKNITYREMLGSIYIKTGQWKEAIEQYNKILSIDSTNIPSMFAVAQLTGQKNPAEALLLYERILQRTTPTAETYLQIAELNLRLQRYEKAIEAFEKTVQLQPNNTALKQSLGEMYIRAKQYDKALTLYNDLLEENPESPELRGAIAEIYLEKEDWKKAKEQFSVILQTKDTLTADAYFRIGTAYFTQSTKATKEDSTLLSETENIFQKFLQLYPEDWRATAYLGLLSRLQKNDSAAQTYFEKSLRNESKNPEIWWQLGWLYLDKKQYEEAIATVEKACQAIPNNARLYMLLGIIYGRASRNEEAIAPLEKSVELNPNDVNTLSTLGYTYDALKRFAESDSTYERALRIDPESPFVLNNYAYSLAERNVQIQRALAMSKKSLEKDSTNTSYLDTYGWILYKLEKYEEAKIYIEKAISLGEANAVIYEHLGDIYKKLNQPEKAKEYWNKALLMDEKNTALKEKIEKEK